ncbi:MAG: hypothetical protein IJ733_16460 [Lachnospiraceae bacterium]|nr:hypothetical protein [Lachnospiraceae bacterium]
MTLEEPYSMKIEEWYRVNPSSFFFGGNENRGYILTDKAPKEAVRRIDQ